MKEHIEYVATLLETFSFSLLYWSDSILTIEKKRFSPSEILATEKNAAQEIPIESNKEEEVCPELT